MAEANPTKTTLEKYAAKIPQGHMKKIDFFVKLLKCDFVTNSATYNHDHLK